LFKANTPIVLQQFILFIVPAEYIHMFKLRQCVPYVNII
jgi:hypothetical protein